MSDDHTITMICLPIDVRPNMVRARGSLTKSCANCGTAVSVSPASLARSAGRELKIVCTRCAPRIDGPGRSPPGSR